MIVEALTAVLLRLRDESALSTALVSRTAGSRSLLAAHGSERQGRIVYDGASAVLAADPKRLARLIGLAG